MSDKPITDENAFAIAQLVRHAMKTSYSMISRESLANFEVATAVEAVMQLLVAKGVVTADELGVAREAAADRLAEQRTGKFMGPAVTLAAPEEVARPPEILDCDTRRPHCKTACCSFYKVILTEDEVRENTLLWDLGAPYSLPRSPEGYCAYLDTQALRCTVWEDRPHVCRGYSCREDKQIWADFSAMVPTERVTRLGRKRAANPGGTDE